MLPQKLEFPRLQWHQANEQRLARESLDPHESSEAGTLLSDETELLTGDESASFSTRSSLKIRRMTRKIANAKKPKWNVVITTEECMLN